jgi:hypothetical protein
MMEHVVPDEDSVKLKALAQPIETLGPLLPGFDWTLCVAPKERSFLTTDEPVLLTVPRDNPYVDPTGGDNRHVWLYFPLGRSHALHLQGQRGQSYGRAIAVERLKPANVVRMNDYLVELADRYVYCSNEGQARRLSTRGRPGVDLRRL